MDGLDLLIDEIFVPSGSKFRPSYRTEALSVRGQISLRKLLLPSAIQVAGR